MGSTESMSRDIRVCTPRYLPREQLARADEIAYQINPKNRPPDAAMAAAAPGEKERLALVRRVYWGKAGVRLTVGFLDNPPKDLQARILLHMNAWNKTANVQFVASSTDPQVRIARVNSPPDKAGYWSYLGTDIGSIDKAEQTMNLEGFTMDTDDSEFHRVVRHETGHTLGFPHEHMRAALVARLDRKKVIAEFMATQGWSEDEVVRQVLTPLEDSSLLGSPTADARSIMWYQIAANLTLDGAAIPGGLDIDPLDYQMAASFYPKA